MPGSTALWRKLRRLAASVANAGAEHGRVASPIPLWLHLTSVLLLYAAAAVWWREILTAEYRLTDEQSFLWAVEHVRAGESPYRTVSFIYPPTLTVLGARLSESWNLHAVALAARAVNLLAGCLAVWGSVSLLRWSWPATMTLAVALTVWAPPVAEAVVIGNLSMLAIGFTIVAFLSWKRAPVPSGLLLGVGLAIKPVAAGALLLLLTHRPVDGGREKWIAGSTAILVCSGWLLVGFQFLPEMWHRMSSYPVSIVGASVGSWLLSVLRVMWCFGIELPPILIFVVVGAVGVLVVRRRPHGETELLCISATAALLALPVVWGHTMLLAFPVLALALAALVRRLQAHGWRLGSRTYGRGIAWPEPLLVGLAITAVLFSNGSGAAAEWPLWAQGLFTAVPTFSPLALCIYALRHRDGSPFSPDGLAAG